MAPIVLLSVAILTLALDQASKALVMSRLPERGLSAVAGHAGLRRVLNARGGLLPLSPRAALLLWLVAAAGVGFAAVRYPPLEAAAAVGLGLALGGAAGNVVDRLRRGGVVDFIAVWRWPTFNLADAAIVSGVALGAWSLL